MSSSIDDATLASWDAVETAARVRSRDVKARDVVDAALRRASEAAHLGAIVAATPERARGASSTPGDGALAGVPTYVKDLAQVAGVPTAWGSRGSASYVSKKSERFVADFERTGLVVLGKSATPEMGLTATTEPLSSGPCRNPWDLTRSSGGSSGGAAALVAAGVVPIAHASDGGGSIRIPAACSGLVGLKPSRFRLDMEGSNLLPINVATDGVVTRTVRDTVAFYDAIEPLRTRARGLPPIGRVDRGGSRSLKIGVYVDAPIGTEVDPEVQRAVREAGETCRRLGHEVQEIHCPFAGSVLDDFLDYWGLLAWLQTTSAKIMLHRGFDTSLVEPWTLGLAKTFTDAKRKVAAAVVRLRGFERRYTEIMRRWDVLLSPTIAQPAVPLGYIAGHCAFDEVYQRLRAYCCFTPIQNASGAPAISLPLGRSATDLPIGVQFAGTFGNDRTLLELALQLEEATPWPLVAPKEKWARVAG